MHGCHRRFRLCGLLTALTRLALALALALALILLRTVLLALLLRWSVRVLVLDGVDSPLLFRLAPLSKVAGW
jgi:hypothetical protein